jgi:hypothetical protein
MGIHQYLDDEDLTEKEITDALQRPRDFGYFNDVDDGMFVTWSLGPIIETRDSDCLERCNAEALRRYLATMPELADDWRITPCSHWAVGHVDHLSYRVIKDGKASKMARIVKAWFHYLDKVHPVADEDLLTEMEHEEAQEVWERCYSDKDRLEYIRKYRSQFDFRDFQDLLGCVRGKYFAGYASELIYR